MANVGTKVMDASKQLSSADRDRMSALDMALYGKAMASEEDVVGSNVDFEDEDWKMVVETAKSGGVGSWFASRVDFRVNGTRIRGKKGYSVSGGVVPLFDGAAIDLKKARLKAPKQNEAKSDSIGGSPDEYQNWVEGTGGQLVLAPFNTQNVVPFRMDQVVVTEKGIMGKSDKSFRFVRGDEEITGSSLVLRGDYAVLYGVRAEKGNEKEEVHEHAAVTRAGLRLYYLPKPEEESGQKTVPEEIEETVLPEESPDVAAESHDRGELADDSETQTPGDTIISLVQDIGREIGPVDTAIGPVQILADLEAGDFSASSETTIATSEKEEPSLGEQVKASALDKLKVLGQEILTGKRSVQDVSSQILSEAKAVWEELSGDELKEAWKSIPDVCRSFLYENMSEDDVKAFMKHLAPSDSLMNLLGMKEDATQELEPQSGSKDFTLPPFYLFPPFLEFDLSISPEYSFGAYINGKVDGLYNIWKSAEGQTTNINLEAGLKGHLSLKASAALTAGLPYLISLSAGLSASAILTGFLDSTDTFLKGTVGLSLKKEPNGKIVLADDIKASINGGLELKGSLDAGVNARFLLWKKDLFSYNLMTWGLAEFFMTFGFSKDKGNEGVLSGWKMDQASFSVDGIMQNFLKKNNIKTYYGFNTSESKKDPMLSYEEAEKSFQTALTWLKLFHSQGSEDPRVLVETGDEESGLEKVSDIGSQVQNKFLTAWSNARISLEDQNKRLTELKSAHYTSNIKKAKNSIQKHEIRLAEMKRYYDENMKSPDSSTRKEFKPPFEYYKSLAGNTGLGFTRAMQIKAEKKVYTYDNILAYEKRRREEVVSEKFDSKKAKEKKSIYANAQLLEDYEKKRLDEVEANKRKLIDDLEKLKNNLMNEKEFFEIYAAKLSTEKLLQYGYPKLFFAYLRDKIYAQANKNEALDALTSTQSNKEAFKDNKKEAIRQYLSLKKRQNQKITESTLLTSIWGENIYRTASVDDLIQFELNQIVSANLELQGLDEPGFDKKKFKKRYTDWTSSKTTEGNTGLIPYMTLDLLLSYENQRLSKLKKIKDREKHEKRIKWLNLRLLSVRGADSAVARELEIQYMKEYFANVEFNATQVLKDTKDMELADLQILRVSQTEPHQNRIDAIVKAKEEGKSIIEIWEAYEKAGGQRTEISKFQETKFIDNEAVTLDDIERFESFAVIESVGMEKWNEYEQISQMFEEKKSYAEMLDFYTTKNGERDTQKLDEYANDIRIRLMAGSLQKENGDKYTPEDILNKEKKFDTSLAKRHRDRLTLIMENKKLPYLELLAMYDKKTMEDGEGIWGTFRNLMSTSGIITFRNGFERSLGKKEPNESVLDEYEEMMKAKIGKKHTERIEELTIGANEITEEEKKERLLRYMEKAKGFKKDKEIKKAVEAERERLLFYAEPQEMYQNIIEYETGRKENYEMLVQKLEKPIQKTEYTIAALKRNETDCESVMTFFDNMKKDAKSVWTMEDTYKQFEEMSNQILSRQKTEIEIKELENNTSKRADEITVREDIYKQLQASLETDDIPDFV